MITKEELKISDTEYYDTSVERLANEANNTNEYALRRMSARELKRWFMRPSSLIRAKYNYLVSLLDGLDSDGNLTKDSILGIVQTGIPLLPTLYDVFVAFRDGRLPDAIVVGDGKTLRMVLNELEEGIQKNAEAIEELEKAIEEIVEDISKIEEAVRAVVEAAARGDFNGKDGNPGVYVGSGEMPEGYTVQVDPEGDDVLVFDPVEATEDMTQSVGMDADGRLWTAPGSGAASAAYYTPTASQPDAYTLTIAFTPSREGMPTIEEQKVMLPIGATGKDGEKGEKGDPGEAGPKGDTGATGATGPQGPKGEKGDKGDTGAQGPQGEKGDTGATGAQGPQGEKGDKGDTGAQGPKGDKGDPGTAYTLTDTDKNTIAMAVKASLVTETWTFILEDGSTVTKAVYVG